LIARKASCLLNNSGDGMKVILIVTAAMLVASPALSKGCIRGAAVGGAAGHFVGKGHAVAGAAVGCVVGHHRAKVAARKQASSAHH
jgi:outer membrane lipoprotein SlyB